MMLNLLFCFPAHGSCAASYLDIAASAVAEAVSSEKHAGNFALKRVIPILFCMQKHYTVRLMVSENNQSYFVGRRCFPYTYWSF